MALTFELKGIEDWDNKCLYTNDAGERVVHPTTETLIFAMMFIGVQDLKTDEQVLEAVKRLRVYEGVFGALRKRGTEPVYFTGEEVLAHKGLVTNAGRETRAAFVKKIWKNLDHEVKFETKAKAKAAE
jgi:hypothetical protein